MPKRCKCWQQYVAQHSDSDTSMWVAPNPADEAERNEQNHLLHQAMTELPDRQHVTVMLRIVEGLSASETAELMGVTVATVRSNLRHAVSRLRSIMEDPRE